MDNNDSKREPTHGKPIIKALFHFFSGHTLTVYCDELLFDKETLEYPWYGN